MPVVIWLVVVSWGCPGNLHRMWLQEAQSLHYSSWVHHSALSNTEKCPGILMRSRLWQRKKLFKRALRVLMIQKITTEQTRFEEPFILQSWKGGGFTVSRQPSDLRRFRLHLAHRRRCFQSLLTSLSMLYSTPVPTSPAFPLLLLNSNPSGKFLPLLATQRYPNCLHGEAAPDTKAGS